MYAFFILGGHFLMNAYFGTKYFSSDGSLRFKLLNVLVIHYFTNYQEMYFCIV